MVTTSFQKCLKILVISFKRVPNVKFKFCDQSSIPMEYQTNSSQRMSNIFEYNHFDLLAMLP